jgi:Methyltransferase domain
MVSKNPHLARYIESGMKRVAGWFARSDVQIFSILLENQIAKGNSGSVVEVGVHHGKSFIPLALSNDGSNCYVIDVFENQAANIDQSGHGDRSVLERNLAAYGIDPQGVVIDSRLSTVVQPGEILAKVGPVRFFHIDGGHHFSAVYNDMALADATLAPHGVVAADDVFRPEWPEVSMAIFAFLREGKADLVPFAIGFNKTYFCRRAMVAQYQAALKADRFLAMYFGRDYAAEGENILVFQRYMLPEWGWKFRLQHYLTTYHPNLAFRIFKARGLV